MVFFVYGIFMVFIVIICKVEFQISDMDCGYYVIYMFILVQYLLEIDDCLMVWLLVFVLNVDDCLEFGCGLSVDDELDLWCCDYIGDIELWIELGQLDELCLCKVVGCFCVVQLIIYGGCVIDIWWECNVVVVNKLLVLEVMDLLVDFVVEWGVQVECIMCWDVLIQDGEVQLFLDKV